MRWLHRRKLSRHKLRGGKLHSWFGDRLLAKELWSPKRESLARAWLVGWFITVVPFLPGQSILACIAALMVRGNLLLCIGLQFLSNPITAPVQLTSCYFVGEIVRHGSVTRAWRHARDKPTEQVAEAAKSLYLGAIIIGVLGGAAGYGIIQRTWREKPRRPRISGPGDTTTPIP